MKRPAWRRAAALLPVAAAVVLLTAGGRDARAQEPVTVIVGDFFFCERGAPPETCTTTVNVGDSVVWEYPQGTAGHTVTHCGDSCEDATDDPLFDSGGIDPGGTFSFAFQQAGTYLYRCDFHPDAMRASVVVRGSVTPTQEPTPTSAPTAAPTPVATETTTPTTLPSPTIVPVDGDSGEDDGVAVWLLGLVAAVAVGGLLVGAAVFRRLRS